MLPIKILVIAIFAVAIPNAVVAQTPFQKKAITLRRFFEKQHYKPVNWNDSASATLFNQWIYNLDRKKLIFTEGDIQQLKSFQAGLDEELMGKGWAFFDKSVAVYKARAKQADSIVKTLATKPFDFKIAESVTFPVKGYATDEKELSQRWKLYLKLMVLRHIAEEYADSIKSPAAFASLVKEHEEEARKFISDDEKDYFETSLTDPNFQAKLQDEYLNTIAWCYDPHSNYMNTKAREEFKAATSAKQFGTGMDFEVDDEGGLTVDFLEPGGSAWRSGQIHKGDVITKVRIRGKDKRVEELSEKEWMESFGGISRDELIVTIRAKNGEIRVVTLPKEIEEDDESVVKSFLLKGKKNVGYIHLPGFYTRDEGKERNYDGAANDVSKEIVKLKKDNIAGLVLDLRDNGGGSIWEAIQLAGIFIDYGPVASMKDKEGKVNFLKDPNRGSMYDGPMIVLVNGSSASASEFIGAALQDYKKAIIIGSPTYGKGTAQVVLPLDTGVVDPSRKYEDFVKVTTDKFYRVNGQTVQWTGVIPDIQLPSGFSGDRYREKFIPTALTPDFSKVGTFQSFTEPPVAMLAEKSRQRIATNPYFTFMKDLGNFTEKYNSGYTSSLEPEKFAGAFFEMMRYFNQQKEDSIPEKLQVPADNNGFDSARISKMGEAAKEGNNDYLEAIKNDPVIFEALKVMEDWIP